jgi:hypothetical protein
MVMDGEVRLAGLTPELRQAAERAGLRVTRPWWGDPAIRFAEQAELAPILSALARLGFAFLRDHRQGWCPEDILLDLRERGLFEGPVRACGFDGEAWQVRDVP